jgi:hypothetical protein
MKDTTTMVDAMAVVAAAPLATVDNLMQRRERKTAEHVGQVLLDLRQFAKREGAGRVMVALEAAYFEVLSLTTGMGAPTKPARRL